jgi:hypothetical protein
MKQVVLVIVFVALFFGTSFALDCPKCKVEMTEREDSYICPKCSLIIPITRTKIYPTAPNKSNEIMRKKRQEIKQPSGSIPSQRPQEEFGVTERRRAEGDALDVFGKVIESLKYRQFGTLYDNIAFTYVWKREHFTKDMENTPELATSWQTVRDVEATAIYPWRVDVTAKIGFKDGAGQTQFKNVTLQFRKYDSITGSDKVLTPRGGTWKLMAGDLILLFPQTSSTSPYWYWKR